MTNSSLEKQIIILAAGKGSRMQSELPKVMHKVGGKPMLRCVVDNCKQVAKDLVLVYSEHIEQYLDQFPEVQRAHQRMQLGTAHAVASAMDYISDEKEVAVIYGDNPLITGQIIEDLFTELEKSGAALVTLAFEHTEPNQYGRIVTDRAGNFQRIVEYKFADEKERAITLCNSGVMVFKPGILKRFLPACLTPNPETPERELYLTDIVEHAAKAGEKVGYHTPSNSQLVIGVNTKEELDQANKVVG